MGIDFTIFVVDASKKLTNYEESQVEKLVKQMEGAIALRDSGSGKLQTRGSGGGKQGEYWGDLRTHN